MHGVDTVDLVRYFSERKSLVDKALDARLPGAEVEPAPVHCAMRYAVLSGGKRLRPILSLAVADLAGCPPEDFLDASCSVELAHAASLILDDLPSMDDAQFRRNQPCTHIEFGEATAQLAVVGLLSLAFEWVARNASENGRAALAVKTLAHALGTRGLICGQHLDLRFETESASLEQVESVCRQKAGALFVAAAKIPAILAGMDAQQIARLDEYAAKMGIAFQVADDLIDAGNPGEDACKSTFLSLLGAEGAKKRLAELIEESVAAVAPFGPRAVTLEEMARYVGARTA